MPQLPQTHAPAPLVVAAAVTALEAVALVVYAVLELFFLSSGRLTMGLTTAFFFALYGVGLGWCAWSVTRGASWARSPIVLAQLIQLGMAFSFWGGDTTPISLVLAVTAIIVLFGVLHPASIEALTGEE